MKKTISLFMAVLMVIFTFPVGVNATPAGYALRFDESGAYCYFPNGTVDSTDTEISFDMSITANSEGDPLISVNSGAFDISATEIKIGSTKIAFDWGETESTHFRHIDVVYSGGTGTVYVDGAYVVSGTAAISGSMYFICYPGTTYVDNLVIKCGGVEKVNCDFEDAAEFSSIIVSDTTAKRAQIPEGSYYDYSPVDYPDNAEFVFGSEADCKALTIGSEETILVGDLNLDSKINSRDIMKLKKLTVNAESFDVRLADFDYNGSINSKDSLFLKQTASGKRPYAYKTYGSSEAVPFDSEQNSAMLTAKEDLDAFDATLKANVNAEDYKYAVITYMTPAKTEDKNSETAVNAAFGAGDTLETFELNTDGKFHAQVIDLSTLADWDGKDATLRFFTEAETGDRIYIDSIIFCAAEHLANKTAKVREGAKADLGIFDPPAEAEFGTYDEFGSLVFRFASENTVTNYVTNGNNSSPVFKVDNDSKGSLLATATSGSDPSIYIDFSSYGASANTYKYVTYVYKVASNTQRQDPVANMYYVCGGIDVPTAGYETEIFSTPKNGIYNGKTIDLSGAGNWSGTIKGIRVDYFTDCSVGDAVYIDSIIFSDTTANAAKSQRLRLNDRNGEPDPEEMTAAGIWNYYRNYFLNENNYEYLSGSQSDLHMYFRFGSYEKLTARSLGDRFARAITNATGYEVTAEIHNGFSNLQSSFNSPMEYTLRYNGKYFIVWVNTHIILDSSYSDALDGTSADPVISYGSAGTWAKDGVSITDSNTFMTSNAMLAFHSNHENRLVETPYGLFAVIPNEENSNTWNQIGGARFQLLRVYEDGTSTVLGTYDMAYSTSKPNIYYYNGRVFFVIPDCQDSYMSVGVGHFDPSSPNSNGSYNISWGRTNLAFAAGTVPGSYGYIQPIYDGENGTITVMACSGLSEGGRFSWSNYNMKTCSWEPGSYTSQLSQTYRHCYLQGYPDGKGGIYVVGIRDLSLEFIGLDKVFSGVDYAWDEANLFHFPSIHSTHYTFHPVTPGDYSQMDRNLYPGVGNSNMDVYMTDGQLHILTTEVHFDSGRGAKYIDASHTVFDVSTPGMTPKLIYKEPVHLVSETSDYSFRMAESTDGTVYVFAMPRDRGARCEIWRMNSETFELEMVGCRQFSDGSTVRTAMICANNKNGSVIDGTVSFIYPIVGNSAQQTKYKIFTVTLP